MSENKLYLVEKILNRRKIKGKYEYKIKWVGYPMKESTWEPMRNLETAKNLVAEYDSTHPIENQNKSSKASCKQKKSTFINKKRKEENEEKVNQNNQNNQKEENLDKSGKNNNIDLKEKDIKNIFKKTYIIDDSLENVETVKQKNQILMAVVDKLDSNGQITKIYIPTEELKKINPWILIKFYESKIKFS